MQCIPTGPSPARIMIVGEGPSEEDARKGAPFMGYSGKELSKMLQEAGIMQSQCFVTNVIRIPAPGNDPTAFIAMRQADVTKQHGLIRDKYCLPPVWEGIARLRQEIDMVRPNVIIALGNIALWALTGNWGITSWRGSILQTDLELTLDYKPKVIPAYHPSVIFRQWKWRPIAVHDLSRAKLHSVSPELIRPDYKFITRPSFPHARLTLQTLLQAVENSPDLFKVSTDIETRSGHIACIGLAWSKVDAICIPLLCTERREGYWSLDEEAELMHLIYHILTHKNCLCIGQNFLYDAQYFHRHLHFLPARVRDTMIAQHACFCNMQKALDFLSSMYCEFHEFWKEEGKTWDEKTGEDQLWVYNCKDAVITYEADEGLQVTVDKLKLRSVHDFQQSLFFPVLRTMLRGIRPDLARRSSFAMHLMDEIAKREAWMIDVLGEVVNIKSPKQMKELFYDQLGQRPIISKKTRQVTCDDEALRKISDREPILRPVIQKIQELRSLGVFLSTFVNAPLDTDGRVRCSFAITGTETYRFASSKNAFGTGLNLQNIPSGSGDEGDSGRLELPNVRTLYIPDRGYTFFDIDLGSADLRIVVWEADEPEMKAMLREGLDPYTEIAKEFYNDRSITKKDPRRQTFKSFAHGTHYLGTAEGLAEKLGLSVHKAQQTQKWYFQRFPRIKVWQDDLKDQVFKRRMVQNIFGHRCYIFDRIEGTLFNQVAAWIPQSTVACLINHIYVKIDAELPETEVLLQVHDSLAGQYPTHLGDWAKGRILKAAEIPLPYNDPLIIPVGIKTSTVSWGDCA